jgi:ATP adenylyltransferase
MDHLWSPWRYQYVQKEKTGSGCVFCRAAASELDQENLVVHRGLNNFVMLNLYPYSTGHLMVVPYQHVDNLQEATRETLEEMILLVRDAQRHLGTVYRAPGSPSISICTYCRAGRAIPTS